MLVFQTDGLPPSSGRTSLATIGWTRKTRAALEKIVTANRAGGAAAGARSATRVVMWWIALDPGWRPMLCGPAAAIKRACDDVFLGDRDPGPPIDRRGPRT